ncbi:hypothetical protein JW711_00895 [Candidatus Woesearchaeota archaeon]|nr:hypothetical protein [Candidatus Woesearchaeota archaeon]
MKLGKIVSTMILSAALTAPIQARGAEDLNAAELLYHLDTLDAENISGSEDGKCALVQYLGEVVVKFPKPVMNKEGPDIMAILYGQIHPGNLVMPGTSVFEAYAKADIEDEWTFLGHYNTTPTKGWKSQKEIDLGKLGKAQYLKIIYKNAYEFIRLPKHYQDVLGIDSIVEMQKNE